MLLEVLNGKHFQPRRKYFLHTLCMCMFFKNADTWIAGYARTQRCVFLEKGGGHFRRACEGFLNMFFIYLDNISVSTTDQETLVSALYQLCAMRSLNL